MKGTSDKFCKKLKGRHFAVKLHRNFKPLVQFHSKVVLNKWYTTFDKGDLTILS